MSLEGLLGALRAAGFKGFINVEVWCPFHARPLIDNGRFWECPLCELGLCYYRRAKCPSCGGVVRLLRGGSLCLNCGKRFTDDEAVAIVAHSFNLTLVEARAVFEEVASRYEG